MTTSNHPQIFQFPPEESGAIRTDFAITPNNTPQSESGTATTYPRYVSRIAQERWSLYNHIPEAIQADLRTGLHSSSTLPYFQAAAKKLNPGASSVPGGGECFIPHGRYYIDGAIPMVDSVEWRGEAREGTIIKAMGDHPNFLVDGASGNQVGRAAVRNLRIDGSGKSNLHSYGVEAVWGNDITVEDVQFRACRWCVVQEYTQGMKLRNLSTAGATSTIRGYFWFKAIDSLLHAGTDNTTEMSECRMEDGDIAMLLHGSNGIQMGGNVALIRAPVRVGAFAESLADGTVFTPGADNDPIHFQHWVGLALDTVPDRGIHIVKGAMPTIKDIRLISLWAGNLTGGEAYMLDADGVDDLVVSGCNTRTLGKSAAWLKNCTNVRLLGITCEAFGGSGGADAVLIENSDRVQVANCTFVKHASNPTPDGVRIEDSTRCSVIGCDFDGDRGVVLVNTTKSVVMGNTMPDGSSVAVEGGTSDYNRIIGNITTVAPTLLGANSVQANN